MRAPLDTMGQAPTGRGFQKSGDGVPSPHPRRPWLRPVSSLTTTRTRTTGLTAAGTPDRRPSARPSSTQARSDMHTSTCTVLHNPDGLIEAELPLDREPYESLVEAVLAWSGPDTLTTRDYEQIGLQLTGARPRGRR